MELYPLVWLRYSGFLVLYPLGVASELTMVYFALPVIHKNKLWNLDLPNKINFGFDYAICCVICVLIYLPGEA